MLTLTVTLTQTPNPKEAPRAFVGVLECCGEPYDGYCCRLTLDSRIRGRES